MATFKVYDSKNIIQKNPTKKHCWCRETKISNAEFITEHQVQKIQQPWFHAQYSNHGSQSNTAAMAPSNVICKSIKSSIQTYHTLIQLTKHNQITLPGGINVTVCLAITVIVISNRINKTISDFLSCHWKPEHRRECDSDSRMPGSSGSSSSCSVYTILEGKLLGTSLNFFVPIQMNVIEITCLGSCLDKKTQESYRALRIGIYISQTDRHIYTS